MGNRRFDKPYNIGVRRITIAGTFVPLTGSGTVVASTVQGFGFGYAPENNVMTLQTSARPGIAGTPGIVRTSTGLYTVTLDDSYLALESLVCSMQIPSTGYGAALPSVNPVTSPSFGVANTASSFQIAISTVSTGALVDAAASMAISFVAIIRDSNVQYQPV